MNDATLRLRITGKQDPFAKKTHTHTHTQKKKNPALIVQ